MIKLSERHRTKPRLGDVYFHFHLLKVTVGCQNCCGDGTDTTADHKSMSASAQSCCEPHPVVVQMCAVKVAWMLELVHPVRGEWLTVIPKLGKNTKL